MPIPTGGPGLPNGQNPSGRPAGLPTTGAPAGNRAPAGGGLPTSLPTNPRPERRTSLPTTPPPPVRRKPSPQDDSFENIDDEFDEFDDESMEDHEEEETYADPEPEPFKPARTPSTSTRRRRPVVVEEEPEDDDYDEEEEDEDIDDEIEDEVDDEETEESSSKGGRFGFLKKGEPKAKKPSRKELATAKKNNNKKDKKTPKAVTHAEDENSNEFVDKKGMILKPFGRNQKTDVSQFDARKNRQQKAALVRYTALGLMGALVLLGVKNAVIPPDIPTEGEIQGIVNTSIGDTGFPQQRATGYAEDFMRAYMTVDPTNQANQRALGYFYTGSLAENSPGLNRSVSSNFKQTILAGPTVYSSKSITPTTGSFVVGALTQSESTDFAAPVDGSAAKWTFFTVNVMYDKATNVMSITKDSPTITPPPSVGPEPAGTREKPLGTEAPEKASETIAPTVIGYVKGYATATTAAHDDLLQYVVPNPTPDLTTGLGGRYTLPEDSASAISYEVFSGTSPGELKARVVVNWVDNVSSGVTSTYTSTYAMTLQQQANGMYLIAKFQPLVYVPASDETE